MKHNFRKLAIWKKARANTLKIYQLTANFPSEEVYGLTSQLKRSIISVQANIAEGSGYGSDKQFTRYLYMAVGSLCESESHIYVAYDLNYITEKELRELEGQLTEQKRMIIGFLKTLKDE